MLFFLLSWMVLLMVVWCPTIFQGVNAGIDICGVK